MINLYTDGSCTKGNCGGWAVIVLNESDLQQPELLYATSITQIENATNNQMELTALLCAIELTQTLYKGQPCTIYTDSSYCAKTWNEWIDTWARNNWINSKKETVKNLSLIQSLYKYYSTDFLRCQVGVAHIHGHEGRLGNELADAACTGNEKKFLRLLKKNSVSLKNLTFI